MRKNTKNIKESLQQQKQISRDYSVRSMCRVSFADMNHEWMYRVHRETRNGADKDAIWKGVSNGREGRN